MTNQKILTKAIEKAIAGGWSFAITDTGFRPIHSWMVGEGLEIVWWLDKNSPPTPINIYQLIFNHDFAKALWGEQEFTGLDVLLNDDIFTGVKRDHYWQFHLQQMVIADDPIKYLGEHI